MTTPEDAAKAAVAAATEQLLRVHWDGTGCGTTGTSACSYCFGPSPATANEVAEIVVKAAYPIVAAAVRAQAADEERQRIKSQIEAAIPPSDRYMPRDTYNGMRDAFRVALDIVAAGSVVAPTEPGDAGECECLLYGNGGFRADCHQFGCQSPVAPAEPEQGGSANDRGHEFTFTVEMQGEGFKWSSTMVPQTVRAYSLAAAISTLAERPLSDWFESEPEADAVRLRQSMDDHLRAVHAERSNFARTHMAALAWRDELVATWPGDYLNPVTLTGQEVVDKLNEILGVGRGPVGQQEDGR